MKKIKIICVVGATASGKTALGVELAKALDGEIISADSMQVYTGMSIATAAATENEREGIPHHLLEFLEPEQSFSVADFVALAKERAFEINARGRVPIIVGGTGLFIDSLVQNITFADVSVNEKLREELMSRDTDELYGELLRLDPKAAKDIHKNNRKRVVRALELYYGGVSKTEQNEASRCEESPFEALYIGINYSDREKLYERINRRVDLMVENGLLNEAEIMLSKSGATAKQAIGHKELKPYFDGSVSLDEALESLKRETRRYAKRQLTWFRKNESIYWLYSDKMSGSELKDAAVAKAKEFLKEV
ncbi:MAG: tRNA (adenosine(37)-N6)-dimethylallyltransferase MiaA [Eubacterium sp.]|nr:tRNA (adenosine(37)-N6)-dimethylallyltransferase MiaA [Eubacterium sp.]